MSEHGDATLTVELLPARHGDSILVTWGRGDHTHRMLVDAGPAIAYDAVSARLAAVGDPRLDLLVLTHIDADHIEGTILLTNDKAVGLEIGEVWFNGWPQLTSELGGLQGEILGAIIHARELPWNAHFDGRSIRVPDEGELQTAALCCDLTLTVLGPGRRQLEVLRDKWQAVCAEAELDVGSEEQALELLHARRNLQPRDTYLLGGQTPDMATLLRTRLRADTTVPNASSIVLLAEMGDRRVLLAGDSTPPVLTAGVRNLLDRRGWDDLPLTAFKLPHHGSSNNVSVDLLGLLPAEEYLVSSDGSYFGHPNEAALANVIAYGPADSMVVFNYENERTSVWDDAALRDRYQYRVAYPEDASSSAVRTWAVST